MKRVLLSNVGTVDIVLKIILGVVIYGVASLLRLGHTVKLYRSVPLVLK